MTDKPKSARSAGEHTKSTRTTQATKARVEAASRKRKTPLSDPIQPNKYGGGNRDGGNSYRVEGSSRFPSPREQLERDIEDHKRTARQLRQGCCFTGEHPALYHDRMVRALEMQLLMMDDPEAVTAWMRAMGSKGGQKGGPARAKKLSSKRRSEIAAKAANARWAKP